MLTLGDFPKPITSGGVAAARLGGALRYWPKQGGSAVVIGLSKAEIADLLTHGTPFATIYEAGAASWMSGGYAAGVQAGNWLRTQFAAAGYTPPCVYLAADSNTLPTVAVNACLDGAASVLGRAMVGLYGYLPQLQSAHDGGHASRFWLTGHYVNPASYPWINVYQCQGSQPAGYPTIVTVSGQTGDGDIAFASDWGQSGADMPLTAADVQLILNTPLSETRPDGSHPTVDEAMGNTYTGVFYGGDYEAVVATLAEIKTQLAAVQGALSSEEAAILAAIQGIQTGQVDITSLANRLAGALVPVLSAADAQQFLAQLAGKLNAAAGQ